MSITQKEKVKILLVGQVSPTTSVVFRTCSLLSHLDLYYLDIYSNTAPVGKRFLGDFTWLEYNDDWLSKLNDFSKYSGELYVICVSYDIAKRIYSLDRENVKLLYASKEIIDVAQSKQLQNDYAQRSGFNLLLTHYSHEEKFEPANYHYPLVVRPVSEQSAATFKVQIVHKAQELQVLASNCAVVAQTFASGMKVVIHASRNKAGHVAQTHFTVPLSHAGFTVVMEKSSLVQQLIDPVEKMLELIEYVGICHFEVIEESGRFYFLDLNLRLGGTTGKAFTLGYNEFFELLKLNDLVLDTDPALKNNEDVVSVVSKVALIKGLVSVLRGQWKQTDYPHLKGFSLFACLFNKLIYGKDEIYSFENRRVAFYFLNDYVIRFFQLFRK